MEKGWNGLPYFTIADHYRKIFGEKVYKIPVSVVDNCPNRMGLKGMETCVFCDEWGSAARTEAFELSLESQITQFRQTISKRFKAHQFLVYFQAYTNTFTKVSSLRQNFETALSFPFVKGFVIGTRPDCISKSVLDLWNEYNQKSFVSVELGVQSFFDDQLEFMKRGHTSQQSLEALFKIAENTKVDLGIHLIFGNPGENDEHIIETARRVNTLPITNIKLHHLHVLKNTPLEDIYKRGEFTPVERDVYAHRVQLFLEHLSPRFYLHRLAAFSSRWDELIAPQWTADKMGTHQYIVDWLRAKSSYQGKKYSPQNEQEKRLLEEIRIQSLPKSPSH